MTASAPHAQPVRQRPQPPQRPRTNAEIDELVTRRLPLIRQAAAAVCRHRVDELTHETLLLWWDRFCKNPVKYWGLLSDPCPAHVVRSCRQMALRVVERWQRQEVAGELVEEASYFAVEWGAANEKVCKAGGVGAKAAGDHIASDEEVREMFAAVQRHGGRVESLDLWIAYTQAEGTTKQAVRMLASGYSRSEIGSKAAYGAAKKCLQGALV